LLELKALFAFIINFRRMYMGSVLFYKKPVVLNREVHSEIKINALSDGYKFALETNSIPLALAEFVDAAKDYAIVFTENDDAYFPIVIVGLEDNKNLFVDASGQWKVNYIPAFVRRYPFILADKVDGDDFNVCLDFEYEGIDDVGGLPLFDEAGKPTPVLSQAMTFLSAYQSEVNRTREFTKKMKEYDLFVSREVQIALPGSDVKTLQGFSVIDEERFNALNNKAVCELFKRGYMSWIYAHLISVRNVSQLLKLSQK
jgi:hypothetical protein